MEVYILFVNLCDMGFPKSRDSEPYTMGVPQREPPVSGTSKSGYVGGMWDSVQALEVLCVDFLAMVGQENEMEVKVEVGDSGQF